MTAGLVALFAARVHRLHWTVVIAVYKIRYDQGMRLNGAMIYVKDLPRMAAFYEMSLGLKPIEETRMDTWVEFDAGGSRLALHAIPAQIASQIEISSPPQPRESNPVKLIFEVEDLALAASRLTALGLVSSKVRGEHAMGLIPRAISSR